MAELTQLLFPATQYTQPLPPVYFCVAKLLELAYGPPSPRLILCTYFVSSFSNDQRCLSILHFRYLAILSGITTHSPVFYASLGRLAPLLIRPVNTTSPFLPSVDLLRPYHCARPTPILTLRSFDHMHKCIANVWRLDHSIRMHLGCPAPRSTDASRMPAASISSHGCIADVWHFDHHARMHHGCLPPHSDSTPASPAPASCSSLSK